MAFSKAHKFQPQLYYASLLCRTLAHPARITAILKIIEFDDWTKPADLKHDLPITQQSLSQHLQILRHMSVLDCQLRDGDIFYKLNDALPVTSQHLRSMIQFTLTVAPHLDFAELEELSKRRTFGTNPS